ncbi:Sorting nexin-33 [Aphelenchoides besseyi]|nr:Sorting nexin-33 [Aphelenchoides besseyi]KAI6211755.1 Sorting nexin-33 [Aphelenchoides besseyi]
MAAQVRATYDFDAQPGSGELTIKEGELLTVVRDNVDGGWIECRNGKQKAGLVPAAYVTRITAASITPVVPPPTQKPAFTQPPLPAVIGSAAFPDPWADPPSAPAAVPQPPTLTQLPSGQSLPSVQSAYPNLGSITSNQEDEFDDEWTEDDEELGGGEGRQDDSKHAVATANNGRPRSHSRGTSGSRTDLSIAEEDSLVEPQKESSPRPDSKEPPIQAKDANRMAVARSRSAGPDTTSLGARQGGGTTRMKNINRFSNFVKSGMENFILDTSKMSSAPTQTYEITFTNNEVRWKPPSELYTCTVDKPKKESKLKGLKSFIAYSLTSSLGGIQVSRRYKHFDWLHEQFSNKFLLIPSPPLPEKQVAGRYEEDLIEHRKNILQLWVNKICQHPVLGQSDVWMHFMTCTDEKKWKSGKRQAEKDEFVGGNFFHCLKVPQRAIELGWMEQQIDGFQRCNRSMDESVRNLYERINESQKRLVGPYKSNWQKIAASFGALGQSFEIDQSAGTAVTTAIKESAHVLHEVGAMHEEHGKRGLEQLLDWLYTYKGLLSNIPDMINVHKSAIAKLRDNERLQSENKLTPQEAEAIRQRVDVITYALLAEITQLNEERNEDFRKMLGDYFEQQSQFYTQIGQKFAHLSKRFQQR